MNTTKQFQKVHSMKFSEAPFRKHKVIGCPKFRTGPITFEKTPEGPEAGKFITEDSY